MKTKEQIIADAQSLGSKATTFRAALRYIAQHRPRIVRPLSAAPQPQDMDRLRAARLHRALDTAPVGSGVTIVRGSGYRTAALVDTALRDAEYDAARRANPRKRNISTGSPKIYAGSDASRRRTIEYKGQFNGFVGSEIICDYQSAVFVSLSGRSAVVVQRAKIVRRIIAPAGLKFSADKNGAKIVRRTDGLDFHPSAEQWQAKNFATIARRELAAKFNAPRAAKRAAIEAKKSAEYAAREAVQAAAREAVQYALESGKCRVTLADSRRAGNCIEGSLRFAERRLGVTRDEILPAAHLFAFSAVRIRAGAAADNGGTPDLAERAIKIAWQRETMVQI